MLLYADLHDSLVPPLHKTHSINSILNSFDSTNTHLESHDPFGIDRYVYEDIAVVGLPKWGCETAEIESIKWIGGSIKLKQLAVNPMLFYESVSRVTMI